VVVVGETIKVVPEAVGDTTLAPGHEPVYHFMVPPPPPSVAVIVTVPPEQLGLILGVRPVGAICCAVTVTVTVAQEELAHTVFILLT
jgi:hypothetical protein